MRRRSAGAGNSLVPRFYFDYSSKGRSSSDDVGTELPNVDAAKAEAVGAAAEWLKDNARPNVELKLSVRNSGTAALFVVKSLHRNERL